MCLNELDVRKPLVESISRRRWGAETPKPGLHIDNFKPRLFYCLHIDSLRVCLALFDKRPTFDPYDQFLRECSVNAWKIQKSQMLHCTPPNRHAWLQVQLQTHDDFTNQRLLKACGVITDYDTAFCLPSFPKLNRSAGRWSGFHGRTWGKWPSSYP